MSKQQLVFRQRAHIVSELQREGLVDDEQAYEVMTDYPDWVLIEMAEELEYDYLT